MKSVTLSLLLFAAASAQDLDCGQGTIRVGNQCVVDFSNACGAGTEYDKASNTCVTTAGRVARAFPAGPSIISDDGNMLLTLDATQKVGVRVGGVQEPTQYLETSNSTVNAVVSALKLGYEMNREIDQIKDIQKVKEDLTTLINTVSNEGDIKRAEIATKVDTALTASQVQMDAAADKIKEDAAKNAEAVQKQLDEAAAAMDKSLTKFQQVSDSKIAANTEAVDELQAALPAFACNNKKKDGDETDVDCGGPLCAPCALNKACATTQDCSGSVCKAGKCDTCKTGDGTVVMKPGVAALCVGGYLQPQLNEPYLKFDSCGRTGEYPPTEGDCRMRQQLTPQRFTLQTDVEYNEGSQVFTAPIDGDYEWTLFGAMGGTDLTCCSSHRNSWSRYGKGGLGGRVVVVQRNVKAGTQFWIRAGQMGYDCLESKANMVDPQVQRYYHCIYNPSGDRGWDNGKQWWEHTATHFGFNACGGFNGGGPAICNHNPGGASGGGATDVRMCKNGGVCDVAPGLTDRFVVAGGGGGGSCEGNDAHGCGAYARYGGHGGGDTGEQGYDNGYVGFGGSQTAGGGGENIGNWGSSRGSLGQGGTGGQNDGGGGGGGFYGGGGAPDNSGGGGGSNYYRGTQASGGMQVSKNDRGANRKDGYVLLRIKG
eukprot:m.198640 g.198640  ORF g.198640 m.198640 type:complete len:652 (+) comp32701_c0_seq1:117-2072(+)